MTLSILNNKINLVPDQFPVNRDKSAKLNAINTKYDAQNFSAIPVESFKAYTLAFSARKQKPSKETSNIDVDSIVKSVKGKKYQGEALYIQEGKIKPVSNIQWDKVKWDNLKTEPIEWKTAKKEDVLAFWHALALCEVQETSWVNKFNPTNVLTALSTGHAISSEKAKEKNNNSIQKLEKFEEAYKKAFVKNQETLKDTSKISLEQLEKKLSEQGHPAYLDQPLIDPKTGKFNIEFTVFDTETTGIGDNDRIIQIGAIQFKDGKQTKLNKFFDPEMEVPKGAANVHHITNEVLKEKGAKPLSKSLKHFTQNYLGNNLLVGYNVGFDIGKLNHETDLYNNVSRKNNKLEKKELCLALDPMLMIQRIHPFVGVRKNLSQQYKFFFGRDVEGHAHDALDDVKATVDILKYSALYLNKHFAPTKDKKALTVGDLLTFQFGGKVNGLDIELDNELKLDKNKTYEKSYIYNFTYADKISDGLIMNEDNLQKLKKDHKEELGVANLKTLEKLQKAMSKEKVKSYSNSTFISVLNHPEFRIEDNKENSREKLINLICENSSNTKNDFLKTTWMKNINPKEAQNDLPDMEISRQVMLNKSPAEIKKMKLPNLSN